MTTFAEDLKNLMNTFDKAKKIYIQQIGSDDGFEEFFTKMVLGNK